MFSDNGRDIKLCGDDHDVDDSGNHDDHYGVDDNDCNKYGCLDGTQQQIVVGGCHHCPRRNSGQPYPLMTMKTSVYLFNM